MIVKVLAGHKSAETAYVVNDYPYGFKLRCKIRYWLEYSPKKGFRFCSQTTNPKASGEVWNTPKKSTYSMLGVMGLDEKGHVSWTGLSIYDFDKVEAFGKEFGEFFDSEQRQVYDFAVKAYKRYQEKKAAMLGGVS